MASSVEEIFEKTIKKVFGKKIWDEEKFKRLYDNVIKKREENLKNGKKAEDGCGRYGDDPTTIELMLYIRKLMREKKLIPDVPLKICIQSESLTMDNLKKFVVLDGKTRSWLTTEYKERFPISYYSEPESHIWDYFENGWDYSKYQKENSLDADIEWLFEYKGKLDHFYYNELDHYLTYLVYVIRTNKPSDRIGQGKNIKEDLKRMPEKDF